jgi:hypothetical protein
MATRYMIVKDYYTEAGDNCTDTWCVIYGTAGEAEVAKRNLENGQDKTWFDPAADAFLYVDVIEVD